MSSNDFRPTASWENLCRRAVVLRRLRAFFDGRGFVEVETPILSADTVVDRHLEPFSLQSGQWPVVSGQSVERGEGRGEREDKGRKAERGRGEQNAEVGMQNAEVKDAERKSRTTRHTPLTTKSDPQSPAPNPSLPGSRPPSLTPRLWLQTSPEFAMKRLLAAGGGRMYQVARVFRQDELGPLHNPEFTLVEWYQPGEGMAAGMTLTSDLCEAILGRGPAERLSYVEAFAQYVGIDPLAISNEQLVATVKKCGIEAPASLDKNDRDVWLDLLMIDRIQPQLGVGRPTLLYGYPASQAALAQVQSDNPLVAERFELYVDGIELANGYHELLDPAELRRRNREVNAQRQADGKEMLPEESRLLAAMEAGLPASVGVALGFDRLVMLALGVSSVAEVMAFPLDRA